jgi:RNA polymerase sigma-70 factor (ECF subfamily)
MWEQVFPESERTEAASQGVDETSQMDEESFRAFYDRTARALWSYLARVSGDRTLADDLVQESYFRFLRARLPEMDEAQRKSYLFRIATNLLHDQWRRGGWRVREQLSDIPELPAHERTAENVQVRSDLTRALEELRPRDRQLLWLAYAEGAKHAEIAKITGLKAQSIRLLLFRARRKLAAALRKRGLGDGE